MPADQSEMPEPALPQLTTESILSEIETYLGYFPHEALAAAIADPERVTPALLQAIRYATDEAEHIADVRQDYMAHLYAMYLLAQFRETRAYPLIVSFVSLPEELLFHIAGDFVTEGLGQVLASVCGGDQSLIRELIENKEIDEFVPGAAVHALVCLVVAGQAEREDILAYFGELLRSDFAREPSYALDDLILHAAHLCPTEIIDDIRAAYERGVAEEGYISLKGVEKHLHAGPEAALDALSKDPSYSLINDTLEDMKWWSCIREAGAFDDDLDEEFDTPDYEPPPRLSVVERSPQFEPIRRETPKVGRNDPCPCGSGKKYKKCCGR